MAYYLRDEGYSSFKKIYSGRKWVGRVYRHADGHYVGQIKQKDNGYLVRTGRTEVEAFENVAAQAMGYDSPAILRQRNRAVREQNRARRIVARDRARRFIEGTTTEKIAVLDEIFGLERGD